MPRRLLFFLFMFWQIAVTAAPYPMLHYTTGNGLPSARVYDIYRDSKGLLWFATDKGIARYNGIRFECFTTFDGISDNEVFSFQEDLNGRLWIGTYNGILCYYSNGIFHNPSNTPFLNMPYRNWSIRGMILSADSSLVVYSLGIVSILDIKGQQCRMLELNHLLKINGDEGFIHAEKLPPDKYLIYRSEGITLIDTSYHVLQIRPYREVGDYRYSICQDQHYLFNSKGIYNMSQQRLFDFRSKMYTPADVCRIYSDGKNFFVGTLNHGLYINDSIHVLDNERITAITQDAAGNYWISTMNGVYRMDNHFMQAQQYDDVYKGQVKYAFADSGSVFFTTDDNSFYRYRDGNVQCLFDYRSYKGSSYKYANQPGYIWYDGAYYCFYDREYFVITGLHSRVPHIVKGFLERQDNCKGVLAANGYIYIKRATEISVLETGRLRHGGNYGHTIVVQPKKKLRILGFTADCTGCVWFSTAAGLYRILDNKAAEQQQFSNITVRWLQAYGRYMLGGSWDNKLLLYDFRKRRLLSVSQHNCIWGPAYATDSNHMLMSTEGKYRMLDLQLMERNMQQGVRTLENPFLPEESDVACITDSVCFFFKKGAVIRLDKKTLFSSVVPPRPFISFLRSGQKTYQPGDTNIRIPYSESRNISVGFTAASFGSPDVLYEYAVSGNGRDEWHPVSGNELNLIAPGYGTITVKLRARTLSSDVSVPAMLQFVVLRPFYATSWFAVLSIIVLSAVIWLLVRAILRYQLRRKEQQHEARISSLRAEYRALNALMNPHFIFNSLTNIQGLVNDKDTRAANQYLKVFSELIRQNMHNVSSELIPLQKEIDLVMNYLKLEKLRFKDRFSYEVDIAEDVETDIITIPPLLVQPLVENAIRHGLLPRQNADNFVSVKIYEQEGSVYIEVRDNGIGISRSAEISAPLHESFGLQNIGRRMEQLCIIHGRNISFDINDITNGEATITGTLAVIKILIDDLS